MNYFKKTFQKFKDMSSTTHSSDNVSPNSTQAMKADVLFPLRPDLPLPENLTEEELFSFLQSVCPEDAPKAEMANYCRQDFRRFVYTWGLAQGITGTALELGANPYFTTMLLERFTNLDLKFGNYFGPHCDSVINQAVTFVEAGEHKRIEFTSQHFNIEEEPFPFESEQFDLVLCCEIIEHLLMDPAAVIQKIKRVLKPGGTLILTTPNVSRLENVSRMVSGTNIYDPYSGYGPYGRHNREYNKHELYLLLTYLGFEVSAMFTADVHSNAVDEDVNLPIYSELLKHREQDLGQYIFVKATSVSPGGQKKPAFLYRSYPEGEIE